MFYEKGWIPLAELTSTLGEYFEQKFDRHARGKGSASAEAPVSAIDQANAAARRDHEIMSSLALTVWEFLEEQTDVGVLLPNGKTVNVSPALVSSGGFLFEFSNFHISISVGTVGSGRILEGSERAADSDESPDSKELMMHYGSALFQPVVLKRDRFESYLKRIKTTPTQEASTEEIVEQIIDLYRSDPVPDKKAKQMIAPDMDSTAWRAHRQEAARREPLVSKRGPRGPRNSRR